MKAELIFRSTALRIGMVVGALALWAVPGVALAVDVALQNTTLVCPSGSTYELILTNAANPPASVTTDQGATSTSMFQTGAATHYIVPSNGNAISDTLTGLTASQGNIVYTISHCNNVPPVPEVPMAAVFPAIGVLTFAAGYGLRRLRRRSSITSDKTAL
jgi:hypothetical protein